MHGQRKQQVSNTPTAAQGLVTGLGRATTS